MSGTGPEYGRFGPLPLPWRLHSFDPAGRLGWRCRDDGSPGSSRACRSCRQRNRERRLGHHVRRQHERAPRGRGPLRPSDEALEPQDAPLHLHGAGRHLHHRPPADAAAARGGLRVLEEHRGPERHGALRRHEEAGPGRRGGPREARRDAVRQPSLARWAAHELAHDPQPDRPPPRAAQAPGGRAARAAARRRSGSSCSDSSRSSTRTSAASPT